ncbi:hypothetical protein V502_07977 [Pseudogymnoascus sp. VKM F-4520 (FW-2644)]|nr:hypothetical protein V502_07977 [Pseudogymnoascus sp. VKM F-4520 (FW-2644)]
MAGAAGAAGPRSADDDAKQVITLYPAQTATPRNEADLAAEVSEVRDKEKRKMGKLERNSAHSRVLTERTSMLEELVAIANNSRALEAWKAQLPKAESGLWCCEVFM